MNSPLIIATRESRLALWQAEFVRDLLVARLGLSVQLLGMTTRGDQILDRSLAKVGGKGLFVKELEVALEQGRAQLAVHSLKDLPMDLPEGFQLAAVLEREDARDAWVSNQYPSWRELPSGALVGTSSLRRVVQIRALRPDLKIEPLRGNLDTRLRKLDGGQYAGIVLAAAGLKRLGLAQRIRAVFEFEDMLPCAGQGALGIEVRSDNKAVHAHVACLLHPPTWLATQAERAVSRGLGGSCSMPLAAHAVWLDDGQLRLSAVLGVDRSEPPSSVWPLLRAVAQADVGNLDAALALGAEVVRQLHGLGAARYLPLPDVQAG
jgi:hydroxymethylbilane synthase